MLSCNFGRYSAVLQLSYFWGMLDGARRFLTVRDANFRYVAQAVFGRTREARKVSELCARTTWSYARRAQCFGTLCRHYLVVRAKRANFWNFVQALFRPPDDSRDGFSHIRCVLPANRGNPWLCMTSVKCKWYKNQKINSHLLADARVPGQTPHV